MVFVFSIILILKVSFGVSLVAVKLSAFLTF